VTDHAPTQSPAGIGRPVDAMIASATGRPAGVVARRGGEEFAAKRSGRNRVHAPKTMAASVEGEHIVA